MLFKRRYNYDYPKIITGKGIYLYSKDKKYIDGCSGAIVASLGHGLVDVVQEATEEMSKYSYLHACQFTTDTIEEYAKKLIQLIPEMDYVWFCSGGSEAVESAIKISWQYLKAIDKLKNRNKIMWTLPGYHGATHLAQSLTSKSRDREFYNGYIEQHPSLTFFSCDRCSYLSKCDKQCLKILDKEFNKKSYCCIIEPIVGASAGVLPACKEWIIELRKKCLENNIIFICDEVMTGMGKTGKWFAFQHYNLNPDIVATAKALSAGLVPLAAVFTTKEIHNKIIDKYGILYHGYTFSNNQLTTAVGNKVLDYMLEYKLIDRVNEMGNYLLDELNYLSIKYKLIGTPRGSGLFYGFDLLNNTGKYFDRADKVAERFVSLALNNGLNLYYSTEFKNNQGDAIIIAPPYIINKKQIDEIIIILEKTIEDFYELK